MRTMHILQRKIFNQEKADGMSFRKKYGYRADEKIIMSAGLTIERKGVTDFVELARRMPQYQFIWFGETNLNTVPMKTSRAVFTHKNICSCAQNSIQ